MYARFLFGITAKFINDCVNTSEKVVITLWGQFVAVLKLWILFQCCFGHESINKQNIVPLFPHELSGNCWSCHNVSNVWQRSPVARPGPGVLRSVHVCTHVSARFLNTELTSSICVLGVCGARGHSLIGVWMLNIQAALRASLYLCNPFTAEEQHTLLSPFSDCTAVWSTHSRSFASAGAHL